MRAAAYAAATASRSDARTYGVVGRTPAKPQVTRPDNLTTLALTMTLAGRS
jgi:hypothetical protein